MSNDVDDLKVQNKWVFFSFQISWITRITDPSVQTNRTLLSLYEPPNIRALR